VHTSGGRELRRVRVASRRVGLVDVLWNGFYQSSSRRPERLQWPFRLHLCGGGATTAAETARWRATCSKRLEATQWTCSGDLCEALRAQTCKQADIVPTICAIPACNQSERSREAPSSIRHQSHLMLIVEIMPDRQHTMHAMPKAAGWPRTSGSGRGVIFGVSGLECSKGLTPSWTHPFVFFFAAEQMQPRGARSELLPALLCTPLMYRARRLAASSNISANPEATPG
jgi:hypothetical protein